LQWFISFGAFVLRKGSDQMPMAEKCAKVILYVILVILCAVFMFSAFVLIRLELSIRQTMVNETTGVVMRVDSRFARGSFRVYVAYTLNGERHLNRLRNSRTFTPFGLREGQQIRIFYDPADLNQIRSDSGILPPLLDGAFILFFFIMTVMAVTGKHDESYPSYPVGTGALFQEFLKSYRAAYYPSKPTMGEIAERIKNISKEEAEKEKKIIMEMIAELERENSAMSFRRWLFPSLARQDREDIEELTEYAESLFMVMGKHMELKRPGEAASWERIESMSQEEVTAKLKEMAARRNRDK